MDPEALRVFFATPREGGRWVEQAQATDQRGTFGKTVVKPLIRRIGPILLILSVPLAFLAPNMKPGTVMLPLDLLHHLAPFSHAVPRDLERVHNPHLSDLVTIYYPWTEMLRRSGGSIPLWNPFSFCGSPLVANAQNGILFPLNWLHLLMPLGAATLVITWAKMSLSGVFTLLFFRKAGFRTAPSLLGALSYMLSGHVIVWLGYPASFPLAMLPVLFWSLENYLASGRYHTLAWVSLAFGLVFIGGQPQTGFLVALAGTVYLVFRSSASRLSKAAIGLGFATAAMLGLCLAAPQLLPFAEYLRGSAASDLRGSFGWKQYPWFTLVSWMSPRFFGDLREGNFWGFSSFLGEAAYIGAIPVAFSTVGLVLGRKTSFYFASAAILVLGCTGLYLPLTQRAYVSVPLLSNIDNNKLLVLVTWGLVSFAVTGMDRLYDGTLSRRTAFITWSCGAAAWAAFVGLAAAFFTEPIRVLGLGAFELREAAWLLVLLVTGATLLYLWKRERLPIALTAAFLWLATAVDLFRVFVYYYPSYPTSYLQPSSGALDFLRSKAGHDRVFGLAGYLPPETSILPGLLDARGYDGMTPSRYYDVLGAIDKDVHSLEKRLPGLHEPVPKQWTHSTLFLRSLEKYRRNQDPRVREALRRLDYWSSDVARIERPALLSIMSVRYILGPADSPLPAAAGFRRVHSSDAAVWENPGALPRAFVCARPRFVGSSRAAFEVISDPGFDFDATAVIEMPDPPAQPISQSHNSDNRLIPAQVVSYSGETVELTAETTQGGWLVLTDLDYPGWEARVDGAPAQILPANYLFRAVRVPPGRHGVTFVYRPGSFYSGAGLSVASLVILIMACTLLTKRGPGTFSGLRLRRRP